MHTAFPIFVTPYVGVWIETFTNRVFMIKYGVTPYVGVWIETTEEERLEAFKKVTPYVGVWIETGLIPDFAATIRHTLRGCVD